MVQIKAYSKSRLANGSGVDYAAFEALASGWLAMPYKSETHTLYLFYRPARTFL